MFSVKIFSVDHYLNFPILGLDPTYSHFRGKEIKQVPVLRVFGANQNGHKTCLHVHGVFPYLHIPHDTIDHESTQKLCYRVAASLDKAINILFGQAASTTQHVYDVIPVAGIPFYGFHHCEHQFLKIRFFNPYILKKAVTLLENGAVLDKIYQPHDAHINYELQFMIDYNLHGMNNILLSEVKYRASAKYKFLLEHVPSELILNENIIRLSTCKMEVDCLDKDILNVHEIINGELFANPGIASIWEDEKQRRRLQNKNSQDVGLKLSQLRLKSDDTASETFFKTRLKERLYTIKNKSQENSGSTVNSLDNSVYPSETPSNSQWLNASISHLNEDINVQFASNKRKPLEFDLNESVINEDLISSLSQTDSNKINSLSNVNNLYNALVDLANYNKLDSDSILSQFSVDQDVSLSIEEDIERESNDLEQTLIEDNSQMENREYIGECKRYFEENKKIDKKDKNEKGNESLFPDKIQSRTECEENKNSDSSCFSDDTDICDEHFSVFYDDVIKMKNSFFFNNSEFDEKMLVKISQTENQDVDTLSDSDDTFIDGVCKRIPQLDGANLNVESNAIKRKTVKRSIKKCDFLQKHFLCDTTGLVYDIKAIKKLSNRGNALKNNKLNEPSLNLITPKMVAEADICSKQNNYKGIQILNVEIFNKESNTFQSTLKAASEHSLNNNMESSPMCNDYQNSYGYVENVKILENETEDLSTMKCTNERFSTLRDVQINSVLNDTFKPLDYSSKNKNVLSNNCEELAFNEAVIDDDFINDFENLTKTYSSNSKPALLVRENPKEVISIEHGDTNFLLQNQPSLNLNVNTSFSFMNYNREQSEHDDIEVKVLISDIIKAISPNEDYEIFHDLYDKYTDYTEKIVTFENCHTVILPVSSKLLEAQKIEVYKKMLNSQELDNKNLSCIYFDEKKNPILIGLPGEFGILKNFNEKELEDLKVNTFGFEKQTDTTEQCKPNNGNDFNLNLNKKERTNQLSLENDISSETNKFGETSIPLKKRLEKIETVQSKTNVSNVRSEKKRSISFRNLNRSTVFQDNYKNVHISNDMSLRNYMQAGLLNSHKSTENILKDDRESTIRENDVNFNEFDNVTEDNIKNNIELQENNVKCQPVISKKQNILSKTNKNKSIKKPKLTVNKTFIIREKTNITNLNIKKTDSNEEQILANANLENENHSVVDQDTNNLASDRQLTNHDTLIEQNFNVLVESKIIDDFEASQMECVDKNNEVENTLRNESKHLEETKKDNLGIKDMTKFSEVFVLLDKHDFIQEKNVTFEKQQNKEVECNLGEKHLETKAIQTEYTESQTDYGSDIVSNLEMKITETKSTNVLKVKQRKSIRLKVKKASNLANRCKVKCINKIIQDQKALNKRLEELSTKICNKLNGPALAVNFENSIPLANKENISDKSAESEYTQNSFIEIFNEIVSPLNPKSNVVETVTSISKCSNIEPDLNYSELENKSEEVNNCVNKNISEHCPINEQIVCKIPLLTLTPSTLNKIPETKTTENRMENENKENTLFIRKRKRSKQLLKNKRNVILQRKYFRKLKEEKLIKKQLLKEKIKKMENKSNSLSQIRTDLKKNVELENLERNISKLLSISTSCKIQKRKFITILYNLLESVKGRTAKDSVRYVKIEKIQEILKKQCIQFTKLRSSFVEKGNSSQSLNLKGRHLQNLEEHFVLNLLSPLSTPEELEEQFMIFLNNSTKLYTPSQPNISNLNKSTLDGKTFADLSIINLEKKEQNIPTKLNKNIEKQSLQLKFEEKIMNTQSNSSLMLSTDSSETQPKLLKKAKPNIIPKQSTSNSCKRRRKNSINKTCNGQIEQNLNETVQVEEKELDDGLIKVNENTINMMSSTSPVSSKAVNIDKCHLKSIKLSKIKENNTMLSDQNNLRMNKTITLRRRDKSSDCLHDYNRRENNSNLTKKYTFKNRQIKNKQKSFEIRNKKGNLKTNKCNLNEVNKNNNKHKLNYKTKIPLKKHCMNITYCKNNFRYTSQRNKVEHKKFLLKKQICTEKGEKKVKYDFSPLLKKKQKAKNNIHEQYEGIKTTNEANEIEKEVQEESISQQIAKTNQPFVGKFDRIVTRSVSKKKLKTPMITAAENFDKRLRDSEFLKRIKQIPSLDGLCNVDSSESSASDDEINTRSSRPKNQASYEPLNIILTHSPKIGYSQQSPPKKRQKYNFDFENERESKVEVSDVLNVKKIGKICNLELGEFSLQPRNKFSSESQHMSQNYNRNDEDVIEYINDNFKNKNVSLTRSLRNKKLILEAKNETESNLKNTTIVEEFKVCALNKNSNIIDSKSTIINLSEIKSKDLKHIYLKEDSNLIKNVVNYVENQHLFHLEDKNIASSKENVEFVSKENLVENINQFNSERETLSKNLNNEIKSPHQSCSNESSVIDTIPSSQIQKIISTVLEKPNKNVKNQYTTALEYDINQCFFPEAGPSRVSNLAPEINLLVDQNSSIVDETKMNYPIINTTQNEIDNNENLSNYDIESVYNVTFANLTNNSENNCTQELSTKQEVFNCEKQFICENISSLHSDEMQFNDASFPANFLNNTTQLTENLTLLDVLGTNLRNRLTKEGFLVLMPKYNPPAYDDVKKSLINYNIPECETEQPFYSVFSDVTGRVEIGNKVLRIPSKCYNDLPKYNSLLNYEELEVWRNKKLREVQMSQTISLEKEHDILKHFAPTNREILIMPNIAPPSFHTVELWLKAKKYIKEENLQSKKTIEKNTKFKIGIPCSPGNELECSDDALTLTPCTPHTSSQNSQKLIQRNITTPSTSSTSSQNSQKLIEPNVVTTACTPNTNSQNSEKAVQPNVSPVLINKSFKRELKNKQLRISLNKSILQKVQSIKNSDIASNELIPCEIAEEKVYSKCSNSLKEFMKNEKENLISLKNKSEHSCLISGASPNNTHEFKMSAENFQNVKVIDNYQYLTIMILELHIKTRDCLKPNPKIDSIEAVFYSIHNDAPQDFELPQQEIGIIIGSTEDRKNTFVSPHSENTKIDFVENEENIFSCIIKLFEKWDPDILVGYDMNFSWSFLLERSFYLKLNLPKHLSRTESRFNTQMNESGMSDLHFTGRIFLEVWRLLRHEISLYSYTFENVVYHILHQRLPKHSFKNLTRWFNDSSKWWITIQYYLKRVQGVMKLLEQLDFIGRTCELARLFGIQFYEVLSRGSQFRVESMMLRLSKPLNFIPVSPSVKQRAHMKAPEFLPLIMEPDSQMYTDPVIVLDFQSLYPSMMIAYNYCFSTCLGRVDHLGVHQPFEFGATHLRVNPKLVKKFLKQNQLNISPCGAAFVNERIREGILPRMLREILDCRLMVKQSMKENKDNATLKRVLHSRQLGLKLIANVTYGYTAANFSGRMPCVELGDSVVSKGRETLERAIKLVEHNEKWKVKVIYGDTDSLFVLVPGRSRQDAFFIGAEIAEAVTNDNPSPVKLKLEKIYQPCILQTKKRYVGYMYESPEQEKPVYDAKGIETVRRDGCPAVAKILEKTLRILFETKDMSLVKQYVCRQFSKLLTGRTNIQDLIFAKEFRGFNGYRPGAMVPALELARRYKLQDPRSEPRRSERVPYIITSGAPGSTLLKLARGPQEVLEDSALKPHIQYYITKVIIPPLNRCLTLCGADVYTWFNEMPRKQTINLPLVISTIEDSKKSTISQHFATTSCASCRKQTLAGICDKCLAQFPQTLFTLYEKVRKWDRSYSNVQKICFSCCGRNSEIDCISLDCPVLYRLSQTKRDFFQIDYVRDIIKVNSIKYENVVRNEKFLNI